MHQENLSLDDFLSSLEKAATPEDKVLLSLELMKASLFRDKQPFFRGFWQGREKAFENLKKLSNSPLWTEYKTLCDEFQKVKSIIDEQAAFTAEQIELALVSLKPQVENLLQNDAGQLAPKLIEQLSSLREEIQKSGMKARQKTSMIAEINPLIEALLPLKKQVKARVIQEVEMLKTDNFVEKEDGFQLITGKRIIDLQDKVKELQTQAKDLKIRSVRETLSKCWNALQQARTDYKNQKNEEREAVRQKIEGLKEAVKSGLEVEEKRKEAVLAAKAVSNRKESTLLFKEIDEALAPIRQKEEQKRESILSQEKQKTAKRAEKLEELKTALQNKQLEEAENSLSSLTLSLQEKLEIEPAFLALKDEILLAQKRELVESSDPTVVEQILDDLERLQKQIRESLDLLKKQGSSARGDFQMAWAYNQALQIHKNRLKAVEVEIENLEEKIAHL